MLSILELWLGKGILETLVGLHSASLSIMASKEDAHQIAARSLHLVCLDNHDKCVALNAGALATRAALRAQLTYSYQVNHPPPLGNPRCQFPDITMPGLCGNIILYKPLPPNAVCAQLLPCQQTLQKRW